MQVGRALAYVTSTYDCLSVPPPLAFLMLAPLLKERKTEPELVPPGVILVFMSPEGVHTSPKACTYKNMIQVRRGDKVRRSEDARSIIHCRLFPVGRSNLPTHSGAGMLGCHVGGVLLLTLLTLTFLVIPPPTVSPHGNFSVPIRFHF
jgi:hypothetical protein